MKRTGNASRRRSFNQKTGKAVRAVIEQLELRRLLTTYTVSVSGDDVGTTYTLPWAVAQAESHIGNQTIAFASSLTIDLTAGPLELDKSSGTLYIENDPSVDLVTIDGSIINDAHSTVVLSGVTVQNDAGYGGVSNNGSLTIVNSVISGGTGVLNGTRYYYGYGSHGGYGSGAGYTPGSYSSGGGFSYTDASLTISDSTITGSSIYWQNGAGVCNIGGNVEIDGSTISDNGVSYNGSGAGIFNKRGEMAVNDCTITGNYTSGFFGQYSGGGGILNTGTLTVSESTISDDDGGGIINEGPYASATVDDSTIISNVDSYGGGICNMADLTITNSTIAYNTADLKGGGICNAGVLNVTDCTISDNFNDYGDGGGIFNLTGEGFTDSRFTTFLTDTSSIDPTVPIGRQRGINQLLLPEGLSSHRFDTESMDTDDSDSVTLQGTIVAENTGDDLYSLDGTFSGTHNLIGDGSGDLSDSSNITGNPELSALGYYGGPTQTFALLSGSQAYGHGSSFETTDQRGFAPRSGAYDIGAFQTQSNTTEFVVNTTEDDPTDFGYLSLRDAINLAGAESGGTVTFASSLTTSGPATIQLNQSNGGDNPLRLDDAPGNVTVDGSAAHPISVIAGTLLSPGSNVFEVASGVTGEIDNLTITGGYYQGSGGGIANFGDLTISNCIITGNKSTNGGGIYNGTSGDLIIENSTISYNYSIMEGNGGGIDNLGTLSIAKSTISNNYADAGGGIASSHDLTISTSTITGNTANEGGGIYQNAGNIKLYDSTLTENDATTIGGGIMLADSTTDNATIEDCTVSGNTAPSNSGGGIYTAHSYNTLVYGTIIAANTGRDLVGFGTFRGTYNLIGDGTGGLSDEPSDHNINGTISSPVSPELTALGFYGGSTKILALLPDSPAIGTGNYFIGTDQRGIARPSGSYDIGAFQTLPLLVVNTLADGPVGYGDLSLRDALALAHAIGGIQTINCSVSLSGTIDLVGGQLAIDTTGNIALNGPGSSLLTIDAQGLSRVFYIASGTNAQISGLTVTDGYSTLGGGIMNNGTLSVAGTVIHGNTATSYGGGIDNLGTLTLSASVVSDNTAQNGGGIWSSDALTISDATVIDSNIAQDGAGIWNNGAINIADSTLSGNSATIEGGGIYTASYTASITNSDISGNYGKYNGGGIHSEGGALIITGSSITGDDRINTSGLGGGIYNIYGTLTLTDCIVSGNSSNGNGGGVQNSFSGTLNISDSTISGNSAADGGGGIMNYAYATISDSTISGNSAGSTGGGTWDGGSVAIVDSTITGNSATYGGGIFNYSSTTVTNSTLYYNSADKGGAIYDPSNGITVTDSSIARNLATDQYGGIYTQISTVFHSILNGSIVVGNTLGDLHGSFVGSANLIGVGTGGLSSSVNILGTTLSLGEILSPLGNYGGQTETMPPVPGSGNPALAGGSAFDGPGSEPIATDQRGFIRPTDSTSDIGAVQVAPDGPYITGSEYLEKGDTYTLNLFAGGTTFDHWSIDWGDGTSSTPGFSDPSVTPTTPTYTTVPAKPIIAATTPVGVANLGLDASYSSTGRQSTPTDGGATAIAVQSNGDVIALVGGELKRFTSTGSLDTSFGTSECVTLPTASSWTGGTPLPHALTWSTIAVAANDQIAVGGQSGDQLYVIFYSADGKTEIHRQSSDSFDASNAGLVQATAISDADGKIAVVGGDASTAGAFYAIIAVFKTSDGSYQWKAAEPSNGQDYGYAQVMVDPSSGYIFTTKGSGKGIDQFDNSTLHIFTPNAIQPTQSDPILSTEYFGDILLGGEDIEEYLPGGATNAYFGSGGLVSTLFSSMPYQVVEMLGQSDGKTLVLGQDTSGDYLLARYSAAGTLDTTFADNGVLTDIFSNSSTLQDPRVIQLANGEYEVAAIDPDGEIDIAEAYKSNFITLVGPPTVSHITVPTASENIPLTVTATVSSGGGLADAMHYVWTLTGAGSFTLPNGGVTSGPSITFTPPIGSAGESWHISLAVTDETETPTTTSASFSSSDFTIQDAPLVISGPVYANVGSSVTFTSNAESGSTFIWTATNGITSATSDLTGCSLSFTPPITGTWSLSVVATHDGESQTAYANLTVAYVPPTVSILGSPVGFAGHAMTFSSNVVQAPGMDDTIDYNWTLINAGGAPFTDDLSGNGTANIVVPGLPTPTGSSENYTLSLTITDSHDGTTSTVEQTLTFSILPDPPSDGPFDFAAIPTMLFDNSGGDTPQASVDFATAETILPNGKIIITGFIGGSDAWDNYGNNAGPDTGADYPEATFMAFIAQFNPDLTLDTTFGPDHTGFEPITNTLPSEYQTFVLPLAITVNPLNQDIVVVGSTNATPYQDGPMPWVGEFLSSSRIVNGEMVPAGSLDPNFNKGNIFILDENSDPDISIPSGHVWNGFATSVVALPDGSVAVGGSQQITDSTGIVLQDFLLFKLTSIATSSGRELDSGFGELIPDTETHTGIAAHSWVLGMTYGPQEVLYATIKSIGLQAQSGGSDKIIVAGYAGASPIIGTEDPFNGDVIDYPEVDFLLQRYDPNGTLDTSFGPDSTGQVVTTAGDFGAAGTDAWLGSMTVLSSGEIITVGMIATAAPVDPPNAAFSSYDYFDGNYTIGIAKYDSDGNRESAILSTSIIDLDGPGGGNVIAAPLYEGLSVGGNPFGVNGGGYAFGPDGSVYVSLNDYYYNGGESTWQLEHIYADGTTDSFFGSEGTATFNVPDNSSWQITVNGMPLWTPEGVYATGALFTMGALNGGGAVAQVDADPMIIRYNLQPEVDDTPVPEINLAAATTQSNSINLVWEGTVSTDAYQIQREDGDSGFETIATVGAGQTSYTDSSNLESGHTYQYEIIPITSDTTGHDILSGTGSNIKGVIYFSNSGATLIDTLSVPLALSEGEDPITTGDLDLISGDQYLVVVSGSVGLAPDYNGLTETEEYFADGAYWYATDTPNINGNVLDSEPFGLAIGGDEESPITPSVPNWGAFNLGNHTYEYVVISNGGALTLAFQSADTISSDYSGHTLKVQIYELASGTSSSNCPIRMITSPVSNNGQPPTISASTPISIISAAPDESSAPWQLWLVSISGPEVELASSTMSVGSLPLDGTAVVTLDPTRFANGLYSLELTDGTGALLDTEEINIEGITKLGDLTQSTTDATISSGGMSLPVTRVYDSDQSGVTGSFGNGWSLNLLNSQLNITQSPEGYDPTKFASDVLHDGDIIQFSGPSSGYAFNFDANRIGTTDNYYADFDNFYGYDPGNPWSDATLKLVPKTISLTIAEGESSIELTKDPVLNEYMYVNSDGDKVAFNPANPDCQLVFVLSDNYNGKTYLIDPTTGEIENYRVAYPDDSITNDGYNSLSSNLNSGLLYYTSAFGMLGDSVGSGQVYDTSIMQTGDLVSLSVPGAGTTVFEFDPTILDESISGGASATSIDYQPGFISLDGSSNILSIIADPSTSEVVGHATIGLSPSTINLVYDQTDNEFLILNRVSKFVGFDPSDPILGLAYQLTTNSGYVYIINATTGRIESCTTTSGLVVYSVDPLTGNIVDGDDNTLLNIEWSGDPLISQINSVQVPGQKAVKYQYNDGNLVVVTDQTGNNTTYSYDDSTNSHLLTGILDSLGISVLSAQYVPTDDSQTNGELLSVTDHNGITFAINYTLPADIAGVRANTDGSGNVVESLYDQHGNVIRAIKPLEKTIEEDGSSNTSLDGYVVDVNNYTYALDQAGNPSPGVGTLTVLQSIDSYVPLQIAAETGQNVVDPSYLRYFEQPLPATLTQETDYVTNGEFIGQVASTTRPIDFAYPTDPITDPATAGIDDNLQVKTINSNFAVVNVAQNAIKPQDVITEILTFTSSTTYLVNVQSISAYHYDTQGDLLESLTSSLQVDPNHTDEDGWSLLEAQGTVSTYSGGKDITTQELIGDIDYQIEPGVGITPGGSGAILNDTTVSDYLTNPPHVDTDNFYYQTDDGNGGITNDLEYSTNAAGQTTFMAYNSSGQNVLSYTYKTIVENGEIVGIWFGSTNVYNDEGQLTDTYQAAYHDNATGPKPHNLYSIGSGDDGVNVDTSKNPVYTAPLRTAHYDYNDLGETTGMVDQYGGMTPYAYDSNGQTIQTTSPNGTVVQTVYDDQNRVIWQTQPFDPAASSCLRVATHTIYNDLDQVIQTETYTGTIIDVSGSASSLSSGGTLTSRTYQYYNSQGQLVETDKETESPTSAIYLRTGTIYYPDGQVAFSGILLSTAENSSETSNPWYASLPSDPSPSEYFSSYTSNVYDVNDPTLNMFYSAVTDQNGNTVKTYQDGMGRTVRTLYADGSFTETLYFNTLQIPDPKKDLEGDPIADPTNWFESNSVDSEVITIAQRMPGTSSPSNPLVLTYDIYDAANRLTDVYLPAVQDNNPLSTTFGLMVNPHWTYLYDVAGDETMEISPDEQAAYQSWLENGSDYDAAHPFTGATTFSYDDKGNQTAQTLPDGESESSTYDQFGNMTKSVDFDGNATLYVYDTSGDVHEGELQGEFYYLPGEAPTSFSSSVAYYNDYTDWNQSTLYTYDNWGRQQEIQDFLYVDSSLIEADTSYVYDAFSNVTEATTPQGTIHYLYDAATQEQIETDTVNTETLYGYDNQGRLKSVSTKLINGSTPTSTSGNLYSPVGLESSTDYPTTLYEYDPAGNKLTETLPDGELTTYTYDDQNRLIQVLEVQGSTQLLNQQYTLNPDGTRATSLEDQEQSGGADQLTFTEWTYDADDRLTGEYVSDMPTSITLPGVDTTGDSSSATLTWDSNEAFVSSGATASAIIAGTEAGIAMLSPLESQSITGNPNDWLLVQSHGTAGDQVWSTFVYRDGTFELDTVTIRSSYGDNPSVALPLLIALPVSYNAFVGTAGALTPINNQLLLRWDGSAYVSIGNTLSGIVSGAQTGIALISPSVADLPVEFFGTLPLNYDSDWLLFDSYGSNHVYEVMGFGMDSVGNFDADDVIIDGDHSGLPHTVEVPSAYNAFASEPDAPVASDGVITLIWDSGNNGYSVGGSVSDIVAGHTAGVALISPSSSSYTGDSTHWEIFASDGGGTSYHWAELAVSLDGVTFSSYGDPTHSSGGATFTTTPDFTVGFSSLSDFAASVPAITTSASGSAFTGSTSSLNYVDIYTYDLDNNRMSEMEFGSDGALNQTITYVYNGNDELLSQLTTIAGTNSFSYTDSTYDANGSMTGQYSDSPASNNSFGTSSSTPVTVTSNTSGSAYAVTTGAGGGVITFINPGTTIGTSDAVANASMFLPNGDILTIGSAIEYNGTNNLQDILLVAYNPTTGLPDTSFGDNGYVLTNINGLAAANAVTLVTVDGTQYILVAGYGKNAEGNRSFALVEYNLDGSLNTTNFGPVVSGGITTYTGIATMAAIGSNDELNAVTVLSNGDIVAAGATQNPSPSLEYPDSIGVVEFTSAGVLMTGSFGDETTPGNPSTRCGYVVTTINGPAAATSIAALSGGDILIAGNEGSDNEGILAEYDSTGTLVPTFGSLGIVIAPNAGWYAITVLSDGDILVAGYEYGPNGHQDIAVAEYSSDSHLVSSFGTGGTAFIDVGGSGAVYAMAINDGKILLTGYGSFTYLDDSNDPQSASALVLAQLTSTGQPDATFGVNGVATILEDTSIAYTGTGLLLPSATSLVLTGFVNNSATSSSEIFVSEYELSPQTTTYGYDVKNKLVSYSDGTTSATYVYDDDGNRVEEAVTASGTTTYSFYLTDTENPTGYSQPLEVWSGTHALLSEDTLQTTYILGDRILGQVDSSGNVSYLLIDGHGSTQQITDSEGFVTSTFSYDAFGTALNFNAATAGTQILFGGDAIYDPASGLYMHGDGVRDTLGFLFIQMDSTQGKSNDPISLHKYLYADADPINGIDPSGHEDDPGGYFATADQAAQDNQNLLSSLTFDGDLSAESAVIDQIASWYNSGWNVAADMLNHFLNGGGSDYSLPASDTGQVANDPRFIAALQQNIATNYTLNGQKLEVKTTGFRAEFNWSLFSNNQLFYAFHDLNIAYEGTAWGSGSNLHYNLSVTISKNYNFDPSSHGQIDYAFPLFNDAWILEQDKKAYKFNFKTTFSAQH